jgi:hypothetical protein
MYHLDKLLHQRDDDLTALRKNRATAASRSNTVRRAPTVEELRAAALARETDQHLGNGTGSTLIKKRRVIGSVDAGEYGRLMVEHDQDADVLNLHGLHIDLADIDRDLRSAIVTTSAAFAAAEAGEEQAAQAGVIGVLVAAICRRHDFIGSKIKEIKSKERYD